MTTTKNRKVESSTGNVFRDLGFRREEAEHLLVRADLMIQVQKLVASRGHKQKPAAKILGVTQPRVSDLLRGSRSLQYGCAYRHAGPAWRYGAADSQGSPSSLIVACRTKVHTQA